MNLSSVFFFVFPRPDMSQHTGQCEMRVRKPEPLDHEDVGGEASRWSGHPGKPHNPKVRDVRRRDLPSYAVPVGDAPACFAAKWQILRFAQRLKKNNGIPVTHNIHGNGIFT